MTVQGPNILNAFMLLNQSVAFPASILITTASVSLWFLCAA